MLQLLHDTNMPFMKYRRYAYLFSGALILATIIWLVAHGDGSQTRDYVYVDDVVSGLVAAATAPNINGLVINIGSGKETSIRDLIKCVQDVTGSNAEVLYNSNTPGGVSRLCADLSLANQKLNYRPSIGLAEGLRLTLKRDSRFK